MFGGWEFANPLMGFWVAAAAIPIALHLLKRRQQQVMPWAAMELLIRVIHQQVRRFRMEQWLLLALRTLALVLFGIALARPQYPVQKSENSTDSSAPKARFNLIVLDTSYSMQLESSSGSRWQHAKDKAIEILNGMQIGDAVSVVRLGNPSSLLNIEPSFETNAIKQAIEQLDCTDGGADLDSCLDWIERVLDEAQESERYPKHYQVHFLTDLGSDTWQDANTGTLARRFYQLQQRVELIQHIGSSESALNNVAVMDFSASQNVAFPSRPLTFSATIHNFGATPLKNFPVQFQTDRKSVVTQFLDCPALEARVVVAELTPPDTPFWNVSVEIPKDSLAVDDLRGLVLPVKKRVRVGCVEGRTGSARMAALSLAPNGTSIGSASAFSPEILSQVELSDQRLLAFDILILCGVNQLTTPQREILSKFNEDGKSILCLIDREADPTAWNAPSSGLNELAGFQLLGPSADDDYTVDPRGYASPFLKPFTNYPESGLITTPIFRYWRIQPSSEQVTTDVALSSGEPWIVRTKNGQGWFACMLSSPSSEQAKGSDAWNAVGTWPSFVPLMQQIVSELLGSHERRRNFLLSESLAGQFETPSSPEVTIVLPDGSQSQFASEQQGASSQREWSYQPHEQSGLYRVQEGAGATEPYWVNIEPNQSSLESISPASLSFLSNKNTDWTEDSAHADPASHAVASDSLARRALVALLVILLAESTLAWSMGRRFA